MKFDWKKLHVDDAGVEFGRRVDALNKLLQAEYAERVQAPMRAARKADDARNLEFSQAASDDLTAPRVLPQITERKAPNVPAAVLRQLLPGGQTDGMLEAMGEIVGPAADLWGSSKPVTEKLGRTAAELAQWAPSTAVQTAVLGGMPMDVQAGGGIIKKLLSRMPEYAEGIAPRAAPQGALSVVKNKGGNWIDGTVEEVMSRLKKSPFNLGVPEAENLANEARVAPLNSWIEGPLTKYVKTRMASPEDEVRKLAEQGVLHFDPSVYGAEVGIHRGVAAARGAPVQVLGKSPLAKEWEDAADAFVWANPASYFRGEPMDNEDWIGKLARDAPSTLIHQPNVMDSTMQGFGHLVDELSNALDPASGLPRNLLLTPEAVQNMSMEKAVRRVADINAWREAQKAAANAELANKASVLREYTKNNPKGLRWVELKASSEVPKKPGAYDYDTRSDVYQELSKQLKYEGDTMGHCVGGYCDDVINGRSRIFSLRDAKGQPHVTVEAGPAELHYDLQDEEMGMEAFLREHPDAANLPYADRVNIWAEWSGMSADEVLAAGEPGVSIVQIKGKGNKKPNDEYLPFVQDFVRNSPVGKGWADVGDIQNTGLTLHQSGKYVTDAEARALAERHFGVPANVRANGPDDIENPWQYANRIKRYDPGMLSDTDKAFLADWEAGNFASGGLVTKSSLDRLYAVL